jgi:hypothetical protein
MGRAAGSYLISLPRYRGSVCERGRKVMVTGEPDRGSATATPLNVSCRVDRISKYLSGHWLDFGCADGGYDEPRPHTPCARPDPGADTPAAARPPAHRAPESNASSRSAGRSPSPASEDSLQQFPDPWLDLINDRTPLCSSIIRTRLASQRRPDRVLRDPQYPGDHLDRQPLRPMQPANLSPIFHRQQPLLVLLARLRARPPDQGVKIRMPRRRQFSRAADMMVQRGFGAVNGQVEVPAGGRVRVVSCAE